MRHPWVWRTSNCSLWTKAEGTQFWVWLVTNNRSGMIPFFMKEAKIDTLCEEKWENPGTLVCSPEGANNEEEHKYSELCAVFVKSRIAFDTQSTTILLEALNIRALQSDNAMLSVRFLRICTSFFTRLETEFAPNIGIKVLMITIEAHQLKLGRSVAHDLHPNFR